MRLITSIVESLRFADSHLRREKILSGFHSVRPNFYGFAVHMRWLFQRAFEATGDLGGCPPPRVRTPRELFLIQLLPPFGRACPLAVNPGQARSLVSYSLTATSTCERST